MIVKINGEPVTLERTMTLSGLVASKGLNSDTIVVEHNMLIVPKCQWHEIILQEDDRVEIVSFMGGG